VRRLLVWSGLGLLAAGVAYVAAVLVAGDDLPRGTTIAGVPVGGLSRDDAVDRLEAVLAERAEASFQVRAAGHTDEVAPEEIGLVLDARASVDQVAGGARWSPATLWERFAGGGEYDADVDVDDERLAGYLISLESRIATEPVDGSVRLTPRGVSVTDPKPGVSVDDAAARHAFAAAYLTDEDVEVPTTEVQPDIGVDEVARARAEFAEPALSGPVTLHFGQAEIVLHPRDFARTLWLKPVDGTLEPRLRPGRVADLLRDLIATRDDEPVDATVRLVKGTPRVIPGKPGVRFDQAEVDAAFLDLVTRPEGERELEIPAEVVQPDVTTEEAEALGITEEVSAFTTYFPYAEYRNVNIGRAADLVSRTIVGPGETFSLNGTVGERTAENGFTKGFIISNGIFKEDLGGGVSQMATTTFNAAFFAGMTDVEHKTHSFYIDRYPVGREATVAWPTVDLQFRNDTPYGVLIHAKVTPSTPSTQGAVTVRFFSTKYWDITTRTGERDNFTSPATRTLDTEDCYPNTGYGGFDIDIWRYWRRAGSTELERTEKMHTTYLPSDTVICQPPGSLQD
jgi:vancomycin resistance protein YoaR